LREFVLRNLGRHRTIEKGKEVLLDVIPLMFGGIELTKEQTDLLNSWFQHKHYLSKDKVK
jgi:hypothetical protein